MLERFVSKVLLKDDISVNEQRAEYYKRRAVLESIQNGALDSFDERIQGVELVDPIDTFQVSLPGEIKELEFAFNQDGIAFARIKGSRYYPIDTKHSEADLKKAKKYEQSAKHYWRRLLNHPNREFETNLFNLLVGFDNLSDSINLSILRLHKCIDNMTVSDDSLDSEIRNT